MCREKYIASADDELNVGARSGCSSLFQSVQAGMLYAYVLKNLLCMWFNRKYGKPAFVIFKYDYYYLYRIKKNTCILQHFDLPFNMGALQVWQKHCITESLTNPISMVRLFLFSGWNQLLYTRWISITNALYNFPLLQFWCACLCASCVAGGAMYGVVRKESLSCRLCGRYTGVDDWYIHLRFQIKLWWKFAQRQIPGRGDFSHTTTT